MLTWHLGGHGPLAPPLNPPLLTISRVIWHWILSWPWNVGQRSLNVIESCTIWKLGYGFLFLFYCWIFHRSTEATGFGKPVSQVTETPVPNRNTAKPTTVYLFHCATISWWITVNFLLSITNPAPIMLYIIYQRPVLDGLSKLQGDKTCIFYLKIHYVIYCNYVFSFLMPL